MKRFLKETDVKILYMGTPEMSATVLSALIESGFDVVGVVCQEDKEVGRKRILTPPPTKIVAMEHNIPVFQPHRIRDDYSFARELNFDVIVTMAYGQIIPSGLLSLSKIGNVNLHGSILPKYRGAAPIQRAIIDGEKETGITLMEMVEAMDAGDMYDIKKVTIEDDDNYTTLSSKMAKAASELICKDLLAYCNGEIKGIKQDENQVTIAKKIKPETEKLSLKYSCKDFVNMVRGLSEIPGGYLFIEGKKLKVYSAKIYSDQKISEVGCVVPDKKKLLIQLSDGIVRLTSIQAEGKKRMDDTSFLQGFHLYEGIKME